MTARREWSREELRDYAREIAARAPEFTPTQIARLRTILWGSGGQPLAPAAQIHPAGLPSGDIASAA